MWVRWRAAMAEALYGPGGFYRAEGAAARHFRTSVHASSRFAGAIAGLLAEVDASMRQPGRLDLVDMGSGTGRLLVEVYEQVEQGLRRRLRLVGVDRGSRPADLPEYVGWASEPPQAVTGLVVANEWLDNVPVDVVELAQDGPRLVLVDRDSGEERIGGRPGEEDRRWLDRWWPLTEPGDRAEVGWPRDEEWVQLVKRLHRGLAIAIDYGHHRHTRPPYGTLTGYWQGYQVRPVPDGSCDITAHVALDACAHATGSLLTTQRDALRGLGVRGERPAHEPGQGGQAYLDGLRVASEEAELIDPGGLGAFGWVVHANGIQVPAALRGAVRA
ncbi:MAG TPA: SAM-dependent methyltransferase [Actinoplanes sp.]|nr:SAM-dependent methyltransferase [Actinoplanes sp.]